MLPSQFLLVILPLPFLPDSQKFQASWGTEVFKKEEEVIKEWRVRSRKGPEAPKPAPEAAEEESEEDGESDGSVQDSESK